MSALQNIIRNGPSKYKAIIGLTRTEDTKDEEILSLAASLINFFESSNAIPENLHALVAIDPKIVGAGGEDNILPIGEGTRYMPSTQQDIMIVVSAFSASDIILSTRIVCLLYTSPSPRDQRGSRMPSSA